MPTHNSLENMPSAALTTHLAALAVRARVAADQAALVEEGLHLALPALLERAPESGSPVACWRVPPSTTCHRHRMLLASTWRRGYSTSRTTRH